MKTPIEEYLEAKERLEGLRKWWLPIEKCSGLAGDIGSGQLLELEREVLLSLLKLRMGTMEFWPELGPPQSVRALSEGGMYVTWPPQYVGKFPVHSEWPTKS